jgi:hypothetical protein
MSLATRSILVQHREVSAVVLTYGLFLGGLLTVAWAIS